MFLVTITMEILIILGCDEDRCVTLFPIYKYVFIQPFHHQQDVTQGQFFGRVKLVWIQFSSRLVAIQKLDNPLCPTIYP